MAPSTLANMEWVLGVGAGLVVAAAVAVAIRERRSADRSRRAAALLRGSSEDLQERVRSLVEDRTTMGNVLSSMEEGVVLLGPTGRVRLSNPAAKRLLGTRPLTQSGLLPTAFQEAAREAAAGGAAVGVEVETGSPSRWTRATAIPVGDDGSALLVLRDVTEAKRLEAVRRDFVANASHELKTPAASIQAAGETIRSAAHDDPAVIPRFAEQLEREAFRLSRIVSDLLDLSRLETGDELDEEVGLDQVVKEERDRFEEAAREGGLTLSIGLRPVSPVRGSARDLSLLVRNLVDNAIRYTRPGGRVDVTLSGQGEEVVLSVADTGVGIPTRELPRIFERFYRVDRARSRETGGTGLGLSIVKHVIENHGGTVNVTSELGRGTCFEVRLPAAGT
ncbi:MAG TPA: ATP-binding protein [Actinomycetota bacterium]|nr:ATP-binding protein [Actinomycetota bacterium]